MNRLTFLFNTITSFLKDKEPEDTWVKKIFSNNTTKEENE
jgi:hypothetical protein